jgi:eukaryotic-like serine/threonine-protein kinase
MDRSPTQARASQALAAALRGSPYRLVRQLAEGGMGTVVEAVHVELEKPVAIKFLRTKARPDLERRLRQEAQVMTRLDHPNLVRVTDLGRARDGTPYLVMERLHGDTLQSELRRRGPLPAGEALQVVSQALRGLEAAHRAGIVHRDVKLDNLFYCAPDAGGARIVKVLDFGIAKVLDNAGPDGVKHATEAGTVMGTPAFLSPEQALAGVVDARTDVYGAAVCLYRLICGRGPFVCPPEVGRRGGEAKLLYLLGAHAKLAPEAPSHWATQPVPAGLDALILRALAKEPAQRPATAAAFADALDALHAGLTCSEVERPSAQLIDDDPTTLNGPGPQVGAEPFVPVDSTVLLAPETEPATLLLSPPTAPGDRSVPVRPETSAPAPLATWAIVHDTPHVLAARKRARRVAERASLVMYVALVMTSALVTFALALALRGAR